MNNKKLIYRNDLDLLKGFAILAVVLYHMSISESGYLGVDAFFVINGFLIVPKVVDDVSIGKFNYVFFLKKRILRLLPLMLLASFFVLFVGYWGMLPDDYENIGESVVATNLFSNNILSAITIRDYWDVRNDYKVLMHTWYIGVLFQFYVVFPLIVLFVKWISKRLRFSFDKYIAIIILFISFLSLCLYLNPTASVGDRFYFLHYRFFELAFGGMAGIWICKERNNHLYKNGVVSGIAFILLLLIIFVGIFSLNDRPVEYNLVSGRRETVESFIPQNILLLLSVVLTMFFVLFDNLQNRLISLLIKVRFFCLLGMMSYSIYIWHQPFLAFYRYFVANELPPHLAVVYFAVVLIISYLTYHYVEHGLKLNGRLKIVIFLLFLLINASALVIYFRAGVVRNVPELYVNKDNVHRNMHAEYVDRIYFYNKDFPKIRDGKINVLIIGNSFARDWGNILLESKMVNKINLSYVFEISENYIDRIKGADYIFIFDWKHNVPLYVWENVKKGAEVWGIGTKNYGESNGVIYRNRHRDNYFSQSIKINHNFIIINEQLKEEWQDKYVNLLDLSLIGKDMVLAFSPDHKFISQDTRHLTKGGARYYAEKIKFETVFKN